MHGLKVATLNVVMQFERGDVQCETWELLFINYAYTYSHLFINHIFIYLHEPTY